MRTLLQLLSWLALVGVLLAPLAYLGHALTLPATKLWLLGCTVAWFATVPFWMDRKSP